MEERPGVDKCLMTIHKEVPVKTESFIKRREGRKSIYQYSHVSAMEDVTGGDIVRSAVRKYSGVDD